MVEQNGLNGCRKFFHGAFRQGSNHLIELVARGDVTQRQRLANRTLWMVTRRLCHGQVLREDGDTRMGRFQASRIAQLASHMVEQTLTQTPESQIEVVLNVVATQHGPFLLIAIFQIAADELDLAGTNPDFSSGKRDQVMFTLAADPA